MSSTVFSPLYYLPSIADCLLESRPLSGDADRGSAKVAPAGGEEEGGDSSVADTPRSAAIAAAAVHTFSEAAKLFDLNTYRISQQPEYQLAYIRTTSKNMVRCPTCLFCFWRFSRGSSRLLAINALVSTRISAPIRHALTRTYFVVSKTSFCLILIAQLKPQNNVGEPDDWN